ncbi:MAG: glycosyltransferase [Chloroflexota bacterium]|nr:glycosyltransferase [Chloroflexota bacterium]
MFSRLDHPPVSYEDYRPLLDPELADQLAKVAGEMGQLKVLHLNSTATGGGVAEILQSMVPLGNSLGIKTERIVINPDAAEFFNVTKKIHNMLQGSQGELSPDELDIYFDCIRRVADDMRTKGLTADVWFVHDPQLLPLARLLPKKEDEIWIWICHIDLTTPNKSVLDALMPLTQDYDQLIFSQLAYVPEDLGDKVPVLIAPPAIDPLTIKNTPMDLLQAQKVVRAMGIDTERPLISQVSRFDLWTDPWGVIDAYYIARESVPGLQLALLGLSQATDDPEGAEVFRTVAEHAGDDPHIHLYFDPTEMPVSVDEVVNAIQTVSRVLMQKSTREGFGLTVTEGMWKGKPVIGGDAGGIRVQIHDGVSGFLVSSPEECARRLVELLKDESLATRTGEAAKESVRQRFLLPRLALDYLTVARSQVNGRLPAVSED